MDATGTVISRSPAAHWDQVRISLPPAIARYVVHKGSIAVDGVSLTVSGLGPPGAGPDGDAWFEVCLIPETLKRTTLGGRQPGEVVNLEVDVIAKYVERLLIPPQAVHGDPGEAQEGPGEAQGDPRWAQQDPRGVWGGREPPHERRDPGGAPPRGNREANAQ